MTLFAAILNGLRKFFSTKIQPFGKTFLQIPVLKPTNGGIFCPFWMQPIAEISKIALEGIPRRKERSGQLTDQGVECLIERP